MIRHDIYNCNAKIVLQGEENKMLKIYNDGHRITAAICCDIDHHAARELRLLLEELICTSRPETLIVDLEQVSFMDSSGIGLIMGRYKKLVPMEGEIYVCNMGISVQRIFKLSGLFKITKHSFQIDRIVNEEVTYE